MTIITAQQPWASAAVHGRLPHINATRPTAHRGASIVYAGGMDPRIKPAFLDDLRRRDWGWSQADVEDSMIGILVVRGCVRAEHSQDELAAGPWLWTVATPMVFREPIPLPDRLASLEECWRSPKLARQILNAIEGAVRSEVWHQLQQTPALDPDSVYPRRRDGWAGD